MVFGFWGLVLFYEVIWLGCAYLGVGKLSGFIFGFAHFLGICFSDFGGFSGFGCFPGFVWLLGFCGFV